MDKKNKDLIYNKVNPTLPFNYKKWAVKEIKKRSEKKSICYSMDYMTSEYEIIPFYKPIIILEPNNAK